MKIIQIYYKENNWIMIYYGIEGRLQTIMIKILDDIANKKGKENNKE